MSDKFRVVISRRTSALVGLTLVMIVWGSTYVVTKAAVREIPPLNLAVLRYLIAAGVLVPIALARGGLMRLPRPLPVGPLVWMGLTGIVILTVGFNYGLVYGSATQGALVYALGPAAVAVAAVLKLHEELSTRRVAGVVLSMTGAALVVASGETGGAAPLATASGRAIELACDAARAASAASLLRAASRQYRA